MRKSIARVRSVVVSVVVGAAFVVVGVAAPVVLAVPADAATQGVSIVDFSFAPAAVTIQAGETVVWTNNGTVAHTVTADDGSFDSGSIAPGHTFSHTFPGAGTVAYHCMFHGAAGGVGMAARVTVRAAAVATTAPSTTTRPSVSVVTTVPAAVSPGGSAGTPTTVTAQLPHTGADDGIAAASAVFLIAIGCTALLGARGRARSRARRARDG